MSVQRLHAERFHIHLGEKGQALVGLGVQVRGDPLPFGRHVGVRAQGAELLVERGFGPRVAHTDGGERVDARAAGDHECEQDAC